MLFDQINHFTATKVRSDSRPQRHPQFMMCAAMFVPQHKLSESPNSRSIDINDWLITASTNPISNAGQSDALQAALGIPLPEMTFGNNYLTLEHHASGWEYAFCTRDALAGVKNGELGEGDGGVKVGYADAWLKSR
jgi:type 2A phosphatase activator TIP41